jgi:AcrR family transcriptional regulator
VISESAPDSAGRPAGRPRDPRLDESISQATIELLAESGYEALSMEAVALRAGTTKTAIYRRWPSKAALVADVFVSRARTKVKIPDTGSLRDDLVSYVRSAIASLTSAPVGQAVLGIVVAAQTHPDLAQLLLKDWVRLRRRVVVAICEAAVLRGELDHGVDVELTGDLLLGPLYYRLLVTGEPVRPQLATRLVDAVMAGLPVNAGVPAR